MWERGWSFIKKAGTIITLSTIILWFLMNFGWADGSFGMLDFGDLEGAALEAAQAECILAKIGSAIAWIFTPLGWTQGGNGWKLSLIHIYIDNDMNDNAFESVIGGIKVFGLQGFMDNCPQRIWRNIQKLTE